MLNMSTFSRWRKVELLDLAEKLKIQDIPHSVRKNELIHKIEDHLNVLNEPLDVEVDYPELKSFYDAIVLKHENEEEAEPAVEADEEEEESVEDTNYSKLDFSEEEDDDSTFKFGFENYVSDIVVRVKQWNESLQDSLSTIQSIDKIFYLIEFYFIIRPLIEHQDAALSVSTLVTWVTGSLLVPGLVAYYINFIRYDLTSIEFDPMVFHLAKFLVSLAILNVKLNTSGDRWDYVRLGLTSWVLYLGQLPLIFALVGALLTLYIF